MNFSQYKEAVYNDAVEWINDNKEYYDRVEDAMDYCRDTITGNDNGSYYCNSYKAEQDCRDCVFDEDFWKAYDWHIDGAVAKENMMHDPETFDVWIRDIAFIEQWCDIEEYFEKVLESNAEEDEEEEE